MGVSDHPPSPATRYPGERTPVRTGSRVGLRAGLITQARGKIICLCWTFKLSSSLWSDTILTEIPQFTRGAGTVIVFSVCVQRRNSASEKPRLLTGQKIFLTILVQEVENNVLLSALELTFPREQTLHTASEGERNEAHWLLLLLVTRECGVKVTYWTYPSTGSVSKDSR
jgi:hypothetical protein